MRCNQSKKSRGYGAYRRTRARWARLVPVVTLAFAWSGVFAPAAQAWANQPPPAPGHTRPLSAAEMRAIVGAQFAMVGCGPTAVPDDGTTGTPYPWEGQAGGVNTFDGNRLTGVPIVGWTARGGLPVQFTLYHNSQATTGTMPLSAKWSHSYNIFLTVDGSTGNATIHWGDARCYTFTANLGGSFSPPTGIHDTLVANGSPVTSYDLTTPDQTKYHLAFYNSMTGGWCVSGISDPNGNTVTCNYNASRELTSIVDPNGRTLTLGYNTGCEITSITDPLSRQWTVTYGTGGDLSQVTWPLVNGSSFNEQFGYDTSGHHDITSWTDRRGHSSTYTYNTNDSLATETDACSNQTTFTYNTAQTVITDANGHTTTHDYDASGRLSDVVDAASNTESYGYDSDNNRTSVTDRRGKLWQFTFDSNGNMLTKQDPYLNQWTWTYNSKNRVLTATDPMSHEVVNTYDSTLNWNLTQTDEKDSTGTVLATTTFGYDAGGHGLLVSKTDANSHTTSYGHNANGDLTSVITPNSRETDFGVDGLGVRTSREDALRRTTTYTLDNWERVTTTTYPDSSTHTFSYDANSNLTGWTDGQGTWARAYDNDNRITSESLNSTTRFSYSYDGTGQKGLLSSMTDPNSRAITYSYTSRNEVSGVSETAGSATYSFDANGNLTGVTNPNGTTVTNVCDDAGRLTSVTNATSGGTTLSSFSYGYNADGQRTSVTEADGSVVSFGYDGQHHLTSESRTGTNPYSKSYVVDGVGNRTSQTVGGTTTTFTLDTDDELTATSGGLSNSYGYNANGEQTSRTLSGTGNTLAYDYDGQLTSITSGGATTSFAYDALGRRISRTAGGTTTQFLSAPDGHVWLESVGSTITATYTWGAGLIRKDGEVPLFDGLGSERTVTNSSQTVTGSINYDAFGQSVGSTGSSSDPYMFAATSGYRNDGDAGLSLVGARYYDAQVGRFITRDTLLDQQPYAYCDGDPVNAVDPDGHLPKRLQKLIREIALAIGIGTGNPNTEPEPIDPKPVIERPIEGSSPPSGGGGPDPNEGGGTANKVITVGGTAAAVYFGWEIVKWGAAVIAAPETGGGSIVLAGAVP